MSSQKVDGSGRMEVQWIIPIGTGVNPTAAVAKVITVLYGALGSGLTLTRTIVETLFARNVRRG